MRPRHRALRLVGRSSVATVASARARAAGAADLFTIGIDASRGRAPARAGPAASTRSRSRSAAGEDLERLEAVRGRPDAPMRVDANEGWTLDGARAHAGLLRARRRARRAAVPAGDRDSFLALARSHPRLPRSSTRAARTSRDLAPAAASPTASTSSSPSRRRREAVRMIHAARALGLHVMLGCMVESQLGMRPPPQLASLADWVDLDGHLLLADAAVHRPPLEGDGCSRPAGRAWGSRPREPAGHPRRRAVRQAHRQDRARRDPLRHARGGRGDRLELCRPDRRRGRAVLREAGANRGEPRGGTRARTGHAADRRRPARRKARPRLEERPARGHRGGTLARGGPPHAAERRARAERGRGANGRRAPRPPQGAARPHSAEGPVQPPGARARGAQRGLRHRDREKA